MTLFLKRGRKAKTVESPGSTRDYPKLENIRVFSVWTCGWWHQLQQCHWHHRSKCLFLIPAIEGISRVIGCLFGQDSQIVLVSGNNLENLLSCEITFNLLHLWGETFFLPLPHRSDPSCIFAMVRINPCICVIIMVCICMYMYSCVQNSVVTHSYIWSKNPYR